MPIKDKKVLADSLKKLSEVLAELAEMLTEAPKTEKPAAEPKVVFTYEQARAVLAEKARTGFRAEVKAILTSHEVKQLSDVKDSELFALIISEAEALGNG